jgi:hypothetical protein
VLKAFSISKYTGTVDILLLYGITHGMFVLALKRGVFAGKTAVNIAELT